MAASCPSVSSFSQTEHHATILGLPWSASTSTLVKTACWGCLPSRHSSIQQSICGMRCSELFVEFIDSQPTWPNGGGHRPVSLWNISDALRINDHAKISWSLWSIIQGDTQYTTDTSDHHITILHAVYYRHQWSSHNYTQYTTDTSDHHIALLYQLDDRNTMQLCCQISIWCN